MSSRWLIEHVDADDAVDYERYVSDLPWTLGGITSHYGFVSSGVKVYRKDWPLDTPFVLRKVYRKDWPLDTPFVLRARPDDPSPTTYNKLVLLASLEDHIYRTRIYFTLELWGNMRYTLADLSLPATIYQKSLQRWVDLMPVILAFGERARHNQGLGEPNNPIQYKHAIEQMPEFKAFEQAARANTKASPRDVIEALLSDPDDPEHYANGGIETWMDTFQRHGWSTWGPSTADTPYYYKYELPAVRDRPIGIFAQHGYDEKLDYPPGYFDRVDNEDDDTDDTDEGPVANIRRRNVNMPDYILFEFDGSHVSWTVPPTKLGQFLTALEPKLKALPPANWNHERTAAIAAVRAALAEAGLPETGNIGRAQ